MGKLFVRKPEVVRAVRWNPTPAIGKDNIASVMMLADIPYSPARERNWDEWNTYVKTARKNGLMIRTSEGTVIAHPGDWVVKDDEGNLHVYKPEVFERIYEPVKYEEE